MSLIVATLQVTGGAVGGLLLFDIDNDPRTAPLIDIGADEDGGITPAEVDTDGKVRLEGFVEFPETRAALVALLDILGFKSLDDRLKVLPSAELELGPEAGPEYGKSQWFHGSAAS